MMTTWTTGTRNRKTGAVDLAVSRAQDTCPTTCPFRGSGCYGETGPAGGLFRLIEKARNVATGTDYGDLLRAFANVPDCGMVRLNVVGDYLIGDEPDHDYIRATNTLSGRGIRVLSYTHAWRIMDPSWFADDTRPQASCETVADVAEALAAGWSAVIVQPDDTLGAERGYVVCPAVTDELTCRDCGLCAKQRKSTVIFPVHGARKRAAAEAISSS
jgi:hypothetical protein